MGAAVSDELRAGLGLGRIPFIALGVVLALFLLVPLMVVVPTSWTSGELLEFPPVGFSLRWYERVFQDPTWTDPFKTSLSISFRASLVATVMGTAAALGMRRIIGGRRGRMMRSVFILPLAIPYVAYALGVYNIFDKLYLQALDSTLPLVMAQAVIAFPLVYVVVAGALSGVDPRLGRAAATLGARWPTIVWKVELPLIRTAIIGGWLFAFALCFDEAVLAIFLAPLTDVTLAQQLFRSTSESIEPTLSAVSTLITLAAILVLGVASLLIARTQARRRSPLIDASAQEGAV
jgi:putative spermidine/putrescine transport system permease protein